MNQTRPIGIFDLTGECPLRCRHCYFYTDVSPVPPDLDDEGFLLKLEQARDTYGIRSAFWIGGEPLLRLDLLREAMALFPRNAIATSGVIPVPTDLGAGLLVSIDGPREVHDALRGEGAFDTAMRNMAELPAQSFALATTLTAESVEYISWLPELVASTRALGILVGFHVGRPGDPSRVDGHRRDQAVDELLRLHRDFPGTLLHSRNAIELFRSRYSEEIAKTCIYKDKAVSFDVNFKIKEPCTFAENASCDACGCPVVIAHAARDGGDEASEGLLQALFPRRETMIGQPAVSGDEASLSL
ncbi:MAG: radical SAM protein [Chlorobi bacterium]|nr:radical SAM protein [Chlorobiota bacterium]